MKGTTSYIQHERMRKEAVIEENAVHIAYRKT
jgi:hypothetical protein